MKDSAKQSMSRTLEWQKLFTDGVIVDRPNEIYSSLMSKEYQQAGQIVCDIVRANGQRKSAQTEGAPISLYAADICRENSAPERKYLTESEKVSNIISFVGKRGMGKTSVMLSFMNFMQEKNRYRSELSGLFPPGELDRVSFVALRYIDTSILKASEDIMTIILARMFRYVRELITSPYGPGNNMADQSRVRALYLQFEQVFQSVMTLNDKCPLLEGESALQRLQTLNSSFSLADSFQMLMNSFLDFVAQWEGSEQQQQYLVIALDDIDRYMPDTQKGELRKNVYTLLGQIDEYLKIPGIIVLATYDESFLKNNCRCCIEEKYKLQGSAVAVNQVEQYLTKVLPNRQKIYMPNLGWEDRNENARLQISLDQSGRKALFEDCPNETKSLTAKELTLCYLADQYGCFFDAMGQKKHFFEEKNLRRLTDLVFVLRLSEQEQNSDGGYSKLMSYIYNHFKSFALTDSEADIFSDWLERTVDRRGEEIVTYIRNERNKLPWADKNDSSGEWNGYSYGELIHSLYCATRIGSEGKTIFSKGMVHCILASYSIVLPRLVENGQIDEMRDKIKNVLGTSISGPWADTILPTIFVSARENDSGIPRPNMWGKLGKFDIGCQLSAVLRIKCLPPSVHVIGDRMETNDAETKRFIQALELLGMFFTNIQLDNHTHNYALRWKHDVTECVLTTDANFACFNILNFVINSFFWEDYFDQFHTMLPEILRRREVSGALQSVAGYRAEEKKVEEAELAVKQAQQKITELGNTSGRAQEVSEAEKNVRAARAKAVNLAEGVMEDLKKDADMAELMAAVERHSLKEEYKAWAKKYGSCALPFQHFDMMYNLLKRQRDGYVHGVKAEAMPKDFLECCQTIYYNFYTALQEQDEFYGKCLPKKRIKFADIYKSCPFIKHIGCIPAAASQSSRKKDVNLVSDGEAIDLLKDWTAQMVENMLVAGADSNFFKV